ncbi:EKC/KEOPS complex subunit CGI121 [Ceratocystis lukuohia]|nr:EKC/KEOPS complex subunit CGI121 [Ceratocystis fimbriata CBS 114723]
MTLPLETIALEHLPATHTLHMVLFQDVKNAEFLHKQLLARNAEFEYALVDAGIATSRHQIMAAVYKAASSDLNGTLRTPNVHSEIVNSLNPTNNISESYSRFGISAKSSNVVVCKLAPADEAVAIWSHLSTNVEGTPVKITDENLAAVTDWQKVNKYYKLNGLQWLGKLAEDQRKVQAKTLVIGSIAVKGV